MKEKRNALDLLTTAEQSHIDRLLGRKEELREQYGKQLEEGKEIHESQLLALYAENDALNRELLAELERFEGESGRLDAAYEQRLKEEERESNLRLLQIKKNYGEALENLKIDEHKFRETLHQME